MCLSIEKGIQINNPNVFIPWHWNAKEVENVLSGHGLKKVSKGYYCLKVWRRALSAKGLHGRI